MSAREIFDKLRKNGWAEVQALVSRGTQEGLHLDFKRSQDDGKGARALDDGKSSLADDDQRNIARALSAFANTEGGVIVFGIKTKKEDDGDHAAQICPLVNCRTFAELVRKRLDEACDPKVPGVRVEAIEDLTGSGSGAVAIYIPSSDAGPHKAKSRGATDFYLRTELGVTPMPYALVASMFGRMPNPRLGIRIVRIQAATIGLWVENTGRGSARSPYVRIELLRDGAPVGMEPHAQSDGWYRADSRRPEGGKWLNFYLNHERVLYARHSMHAVDITAASGSLAKAVVRGFVVCDGAPPVEFEAAIPEVGDSTFVPSHGDE